LYELLPDKMQKIIAITYTLIKNIGDDDDDIFL